MRILPVKGNARDWAELTNNRLQLIATPMGLVGYGFAVGTSDWSWVEALFLAVGTMLVGSATSAFHQLQEVDIDKRMPHTCNRPLPTDRIRRRDAAAWGLGGAIVGLLVLLIVFGWLSAWFAAAMLVTYAFIYTPLKRVTPMNILAGAVPAAFPPVIGYTAGAGSFDTMAGVLFLVMLLWQLPHFLSRAWYRRLDYQIAGLHQLPGVDPTGRRSGRRSVHYALLLIPASQIPMFADAVSSLYFYGAATISLAFMVAVIYIGMVRQDTKGVVMGWASMIYVPALAAWLALDLFLF